MTAKYIYDGLYLIRILPGFEIEFLNPDGEWKHSPRACDIATGHGGDCHTEITLAQAKKIAKRQAPAETEVEWVDDQTID